MKKVLLGATVLTAVAFGAGQAHADGIKLDLAGHAKLYVDYDDQFGANSGNGSDVRSVDILRDTEIHFTGETTLDNGLTVGFHEEADVDSENPTEGEDFFASQESYAYFSGAWGRVNFGKEDGAAYLLQVAAPSADENYDGLRQYVNPFNYTSTTQAGLPLNGAVLDYSQDSTGYANKITYLTPQFSGFQFGGSYTPDVGDDQGLAAGGLGFLHRGFPSALDGSTAYGNRDSNVDAAGVLAPDLGSAWEGSGRWEGQWRNFGITAGGGYTHIFSESSSIGIGSSDVTEYNGGLNIAFGAFNVGGAYLHNSGGLIANSAGRTYVGGIDYTVGPVKFGASWLNNHQEEGIGATAAVPAAVGGGSLNTNRWTGGAVYTYGPGMTFRGSVSYLGSHSDSAGTGDVDGITGLVGTQINF